MNYKFKCTACNGTCERDIPLAERLDEMEVGGAPMFDAVSSYEIYRVPGGYIYKSDYAGMCFVPEANTGVGAIKHSVAKTEPKKMVTK